MVTSGMINNGAYSDANRAYRQGIRLQQEYLRQMLSDITTVLHACTRTAKQGDESAVRAADDVEKRTRERISALLDGADTPPDDWLEIGTDKVSPKLVRNELARRFDEGAAVIRSIDKIVDEMGHAVLEIPLDGKSLWDSLAESVTSDAGLIRAMRTVNEPRQLVDLLEGEKYGSPFFGMSVSDDVPTALATGGDYGHLAMHRGIADLTSDVLDFLVVEARRRLLGRIAVKLERMEPKFREARKAVAAKTGRSLDATTAGIDDDVETAFASVAELWFGGRYTQLVRDARRGRETAFAAFNTIPSTDKVVGVAMRLDELADDLQHSLEMAVRSNQASSSDRDGVERCRRKLLEFVRDGYATEAEMFALDRTGLSALLRADPIIRNRLDNVRLTHRGMPYGEIDQWLDVRPRFEPVWALGDDNEQSFNDTYARALHDESALEGRDIDRMLGMLGMLVETCRQSETFRISLAASRGVVGRGDWSSVIDQLIGNVISNRPDLHGVSELNFDDCESLSTFLSRDTNMLSKEIADPAARELDLIALETYEKSRALGRQTLSRQIHGAFEMALVEIVERDPEQMLAKELARLVGARVLSPTALDELLRSPLCPRVVAHMVRDGIELSDEFRSAFGAGLAYRWPTMPKALAALESLTAEATDTTAGDRTAIKGMETVLRSVENVVVPAARPWAKRLPGRHAPTTVPVREFLRSFARSEETLVSARTTAAELLDFDSRFGHATAATDDVDGLVEQPTKQPDDVSPNPLAVLDAATDAVARRNEAQQQLTAMTAAVETLFEEIPSLRKMMRSSVERLPEDVAGRIRSITSIQQHEPGVMHPVLDSTRNKTSPDDEVSGPTVRRRAAPRRASLPPIGGSDTRPSQSSREPAPSMMGWDGEASQSHPHGSPLGDHEEVSLDQQGAPDGRQTIDPPEPEIGLEGP